MLKSSKMLSYAMKHGMVLSIVFFFIILPSVRAQNSTSTDQNQTNNASFSPSMALIAAVIIVAVFVLGIFSIYVRHCSRASTGGSILPVAGGSHGRSRQRGLDPSIIETFPIFPYSEVKHHVIGKNALECAVCLNEFEDDETLRFLPKCDHVFHPECIDAWLASHTTCPVCRANLMEPATMPPKDYFSERPGELTLREDEVAELPKSVSVRVPQEVAAADEGAERNRFHQARQWGSRSVKSLLFPRSHSTGHSLVLVQPMENTDRFTLRLPDDVRNKILNRSGLNRSTSLVALPRESSSRRGYRTGEGSSRGRYIRGLDRADQTDPWMFTMAPPFLTRGSSVKSAREKSPSNAGEGSSRWTGLFGRMSFNRFGSRHDKSDSNRPPV